MEKFRYMKSNTKIKVQGLEWPLDRYGQMVIEDHCEDGTWSGQVASGYSTGANLAWQDPIDMMIRLPGEITISRDDFKAAFQRACERYDRIGVSPYGADIESELFGESK